MLTSPTMPTLTYDGVPIVSGNLPYMYLPPQVAKDLHTSALIYAIAFGAYAWDFLSFLLEDIRLLRDLKQSRRALGVVAYLVARIGALGYVVLAFIFAGAPLADSCNSLLKAAGAFWVLGATGTAALFSIRAVAVFGRHPVAIIWFGLSVAAVFATSIIVPTGITALSVAGTGYCVNAKVPSYLFGNQVAILINDLTVWISVSWKVLYGATGERSPLSQAKKVSTRGSTALPAVTRELIEGGSLYVLVATLLTVTSLVLLVNESVDPVVHGFLTSLALGINAMMACRIYRDLRNSVQTHVSAHQTRGTARSGIPQYKTTHSSNGSAGQAAFDPNYGVTTTPSATRSPSDGAYVTSVTRPHPFGVVRASAIDDSSEKMVATGAPLEYVPMSDVYRISSTPLGNGTHPHYDISYQQHSEQRRT